MEDAKKTVNKLNHLISIAADGREGYKNAAQDAKDAFLKDTFQRLSRERGTYVDELRSEVNALGGKPEQDGGPIGALHRTWMNLKAAFSSNDKDAIINACLTGENAAIKEYEEALSESAIGGSTKQLVDRQLSGIRNATAAIRAYADEPKK